MPGDELVTGVKFGRDLTSQLELASWEAVDTSDLSCTKELHMGATAAHIKAAASHATEVYKRMAAEQGIDEEMLTEHVISTILTAYEDSLMEALYSGSVQEKLKKAVEDL